MSTLQAPEPLDSLAKRLTDLERLVWSQQRAEIAQRHLAALGTEPRPLVPEVDAATPDAATHARAPSRRTRSRRALLRLGVR